MTRSVIRLCGALIGALVASGIAGGCSQLLQPDVPEPLHSLVEPEQGGKYWFYRPAGYDARLSWPLIVVCHGAYPDSPKQQIRAWALLAETHGFIVVAPALEFRGKGWPLNGARQIARLREDGQHILATVRHVRAGHNISENRIFVYGWSAGAGVALRTGLRHPEIFRAISLAQPLFESEFMTDAEAAVDQHQPIYVNYRVTDVVTGKHGRRCAEWLRSRGADLRDDSAGTVRRADCARTVEFFEEAIRKKPMVRIRAFAADDENPREMQFKLRCSFSPSQYLWEFGDGEGSAVAEPLHLYGKPGTYRVSVAATGRGGRQYQRELEVRIP